MSISLIIIKNINLSGMFDKHFLLEKLTKLKDLSRSYSSLFCGLFYHPLAGRFSVSLYIPQTSQNLPDVAG